MNLAEISTLEIIDYLTEYIYFHSTLSFAEFAQRDKCAHLIKLNS